jgi:hypothetical protein
LGAAGGDIKSTGSSPSVLLIIAIGVISIEECYKLINWRKAAIISHLERLEVVADELPEDKKAHNIIKQHHVASLQTELKLLDDLKAEIDNWDFE